MTLNPKQAQFVREYLVDLNATQAAVRAGYSAKTAEQQGPRLLGNVGVQAAIEAAMTKRAARTELEQDRVVKELSRLAFADIRKVVRWGIKEVGIGFDADGKRLSPEDIGDAAMVQYVNQAYVEPINSDDLDDDAAATIAEVAMTKDGIRIKLHDKGGAITLAGRHLAMWKDRLEVSTDESMAVLLAEARKRLES